MTTDCGDDAEQTERRRELAAHGLPFEQGDRNDR
jgi:hypothetical protein